MTTWPREGTCKMCGNEFQQYRPSSLYCKTNNCNKKRQKHRWNKWRKAREADGTYRDKVNEFQRKYRQRTGYNRIWELQTKYGITFEQWKELVEKADGKCQICDQSDEALCVDHCHRTNKLRGILCRRCNRGLGAISTKGASTEETILQLERALRYLRGSS